MKRQIGLNAIRSLDYTVLLCDDVDQMASFYRMVFGWEPRNEIPGHWAEFQVGSTLLGMRGRSRPYDSSSTQGAAVHLAFRVPLSDLEPCLTQLGELGIELLEPLQTFVEFGHQAFFIADPEHNVIEIYADI